MRVSPVSGAFGLTAFRSKLRASMSARGMVQLRASGPSRHRLEEALERRQRQWILLHHLHTGQVVVPHLRGALTFVEEQHIRFHASDSIDERSRRQTHDVPQIAVVQQLALGLNRRRLVGAE